MKKIIIPILIAGLLLQTCRKDFLDVRPSKSLLVPTTNTDFQALLDNNFVFNYTPGLVDLAADDLYATPEGYNAFDLDMERNTYTWNKDIFAGVPTLDWNSPYQQVFYANIVLEGIGANADPDSRALRGAALFFRGYAFYSLLQEFARPYNPATSQSDPGIPLRLQSDVTLKTGRSTVAAGYAQALADLQLARKLLPATASYKSRPTQTAALALLARVHLAMGHYEAAGKYADSVLASGVKLLDYSTRDSTASRPFPHALPNGNDEVIFYSVLSPYSFLTSSAAVYIDSTLYRSYAAGDLRKPLFGRELEPGRFKFRGNYAAILLFFSGLATDEQYLVSAECRARAGNTAGALERLNSLLVTRFTPGTFTPLAAGDGDILDLVLRERRKELIGRGLRWTDLRRLNQQAATQVTLTRKLDGKTYTLAPNSARYVYPLPDEEVALNGLAQNER